MIGLKCRHNGQWLAAVIGPRRVTCTVHDASALQFTTVEDAESFLRVSGIGQYFELQPLCRPAPATEGKARRARSIARRPNQGVVTDG